MRKSAWLGCEVFLLKCRSWFFTIDCLTVRPTNTTLVSCVQKLFFCMFFSDLGVNLLERALLGRLAAVFERAFSVLNIELLIAQKLFSHETDMHKQQLFKYHCLWFYLWEEKLTKHLLLQKSAHLMKGWCLTAASPLKSFGSIKGVLSIVHITFFLFFGFIFLKTKK